ncbi:MAG: amidohydrolase family protein [Verrucomicrobia bacterium]|nr:amidohydrolase family protein [Verrucomicrobiota bacterium]
MSRWELFIKFALLSSTSILSSMSLSRKTLTLITLAWTMLFITVGARPEFPFPGEKPVGPNLHALVKADIQVDPEHRITKGTLLVRDGVIEKVGKDVKIPAGYRIWDMTGKTIYPGFIDPYLLPDSEDAGLLELKHDEHVHATADLSFHGTPSTRTDSGEKGPGFEVSGVHPERRGINDFQPNDKKWESLRKHGFTTAHLAPSKGIFRGTGPCVLLRTGDPNDLVLKEEVAQVIAFDPVGKEQSPRVYPSSLMGTLAVIRQTFIDTKYAQELILYQKKNPVPVPVVPHAGIRSLQEVLNKKAPFPVWFEPGSCLMESRALSLGKEFGVHPVIIATGDEWRRPDLACSKNHSYVSSLIFPALSKLPDDEDWNQISLDQLRAWDHAPGNPALLAKRTKSLSFTTSGSSLGEFHGNLLQAIGRGLPEEKAIAALTTNPAKICGIDRFAGTIDKGKLANFVVVEGSTYFAKEAKISSTWIQGHPFQYPLNDADKKKGEKDGNATDEKPLNERIAKFPHADRKALESPASVLFTGFKLWTCEKEGILADRDLLVRDGKIVAIGANLKQTIPKDCKLVEGKGMHLTPGIIDCHSHAMILGGVNESTLPSTAMVRISDVVNSESINVERQLAGGVTACNLLHGSANPIGGQNAVIKLRLGASPDAMLMQQAPSGIKFALGENVKQSNWGDKYTTRFPQSRRGVKSFSANRFTAARQYDIRLRQAQEGKGPPLRRNLELEAILEIIRGQRLIHCHSYRQDEILVFLRTMESFGVKIGTLQHVLEGYKVADEIARHGAGASTFSDWWAYKFEVYDAIPYAGAIMHERGCVVSFNSDSPDHARRLNLEAAKAVKYGGLPETEALKFVTLNPAKQLGIDQWVGSLEVGKDADLALWTGNPLDYRSKCEQTWIDGVLYHELNKTREREKRRTKERDTLVAKARSSLNGGKEDKASAKSKEKFFRHCLETACDLFPHSCRTHGHQHQEGSR